MMMTDRRRLMMGLVFVSSAALVLVAIGLGGLVTGCYCVPQLPEVDPNTGQVTIRTDDPLSDQIATDDELPYDRPAAIAALAELDLLEPNLAGYKFAMLFICQNQFDSDIAYDVFVNFQQVGDRRMILAERQDIVVITNDQVEQTEADLRAIPALAGLTPTADIFGKPCPYIVEFRNFVVADDHIITNQRLIMAPLNAPGPDGTQLEPVTKDQPPLRLLPTFECPAIIAYVFEKTRVRAIELDREFTVPDYSPEPQEPADPDEFLFPHAVNLIWLPEQIAVFTEFGREFLLDAY
jgi:hypothetical protein